MSPSPLWALAREAADAALPDVQVPVSSSAIASVGYDPTSFTLTVEFKDSGAAYDYRGVPPGVFAALLIAPSKGRFVSKYIKDRFPVSRA